MLPQAGEEAGTIKPSTMHEKGHDFVQSSIYASRRKNSPSCRL